MAEGGNGQSPTFSESDSSIIVSPLIKDLSSNELMEIADDIEVFSEFCDRMANEQKGEFQPFSSTPKPSTSYELQKERMHLLDHLKGKKTLSERDIYHQALKLEEQEKEQRMATTEEQLKSLRIELQKSQERREQRRIQQETAKVFTGTVIHRRRNISDDDRRINRPKGFLPPWKKSRRRLSMEEMKDLEDDIECPETAEQFCQKMYHEAHQEPNLIPPYIPQQQSSTICQKIRKFARWLFSFCCWPLSF